MECGGTLGGWRRCPLRSKLDLLLPLLLLLPPVMLGAREDMVTVCAVCRMCFVTCMWVGPQKLQPAAQQMMPAYSVLPCASVHWQTVVELLY